jgi:hypothetical protein
MTARRDDEDPLAGTPLAPIANPPALPWVWGAHDVWLSRIRQPRDQASTPSSTTSRATAA